MDTPSMPNTGNVSGSDKKSKIIKIVAAFFIIMAAIAVFVFYLTGAMVKSVNTHLELLKADNIEAAYDMTADGFKEIMNIEDYRMLVTEYPVLQDFSDVSFSNREIINKMGLISGTITSQNGAVYPLTIDLVKEDGEWKIYNMLIGDMHDYLDTTMLMEQPEIYDLLSSVDLDGDGLPIDGKVEFEAGEKITFSGVISELPANATMTNTVVNSFGEEVSEVVVPFDEGGIDVLFYFFLDPTETQILPADDYVYEVSFDHSSLAEPVVANHIISIR